MTDLRATLADLVADLVDPYEHAETIHLRSAIPDGRATQEIRIHRTRHPSLLDQLAAAVEPSSGIGVARGYESSPSARLEAIDMLAAILAGITQWSGTNRTPRQSLRRLVGADMSEPDRIALIADVRTWIAWARVTTGWDTPARRLRGPCPACDTQGSIRVRVEPATALCGACRQTWQGDAEIQILAAHIRSANRDTEIEEIAA